MKHLQPLVQADSRSPLRAIPFLACCGIVFSAGCSESEPKPSPEPNNIRAVTEVSAKEVFPFPSPSGKGYVTSQACQKCHPDEHASWHATYHRKMTQPATPETVLAPFDGRTLEVPGSTAKLEKRGEEFWVDIVDPEWELETYRRGEEGLTADPPRVKRQIVMTTGSHNFQVYWYVRGRGRELWQFPWRYHIGEKRWMHRRDVFLDPIEDWGPGMLTAVWNQNCVLCHSTGGYPGWKAGEEILQHTEVAELGIACEMCHGRGEAHVQAMEALGTPLTAKREVLNATDLKIVNPHRLSPQKSLDVCGRCHSHNQHPVEAFADTHPFQPGMDLRKTVQLLLEPQDQEGARRYWSDGTNCSGGREYNAVLASPCFSEGGMTCLSCHSMHHSDPDDQLAPRMDANDACYQCHESYQKNLVEHTHHPADSSGSLCYNCHMPHTSFALLKPVRSHRIQSPKVTSTHFNSQPNACNLCHLDQTLAWTAEHLQDWFGQPPPQLNLEDQQIAASLVWLLRGDPLQRSLAAWHMSYPPAQKASATDWMAPFLAEVLNDRYAAVRWVAGLSLRKVPGFADFLYEFDAPPAQRQERQKAAQQLWKAIPPPENSPPTPADHLLLREPRKTKREIITRLIQQRDNRRVRLVE